ncbi:MAG: hypothetical protein FWD26_08295 [Treponema sp.]|nr:hypothetical protein [Treponema sp.]
MKKLIFTISAAAILVTITAACFSPWGGDTGTFSISIGSGSRSVIIKDEIVLDIDNLWHTIYLTGGPGPDQNKTIAPGVKSASFYVVPGYWNIDVEAYLLIENDNSGTIEKDIWATGFRHNYHIRAGANPAVTIWMENEEDVELPEVDAYVNTWDELYDFIDSLEEGTFAIIQINSDFYTTVFDDDVSIMSKTITIQNKEIVLVAAEDVTITRSDNFYAELFKVGDDDGGYLILGLEGFNGTITINGNEVFYEFPEQQIYVNSLITVNNNGILIMNKNVTLKGNGNKDELEYYGNIILPYNGGAVYINFGGEFFMNGGEITDNRATQGGGVYVGGTFIMRGGTIFENEGYTGYGGGVYVEEGGYFYMDEEDVISGNMDEKAVISGNIAQNGGGVYVANYGTFHMDDGCIKNNDADAGGGVYVNSSTGASGNGFTMSGGIISGNWAAGSGGGVNVGDAGTFLKSGGGIIYGSFEEGVQIPRPEGDRGDYNKANGSVSEPVGPGYNSGHAVYVNRRSPSQGIEMRHAKIQNENVPPDTTLDSEDDDNWDRILAP